MKKNNIVPSEQSQSAPSQKLVTRRGFLRSLGIGAGAGATGLLTMASPAAALIPTPGKKPFIPARDRRLFLKNPNTRETLDIVFWSRGHYLPGALKQIDYFMRDFRTNDIRKIDPRLLTDLARFYEILGMDEPLGIVSGYRSPRTNSMLQRTSSGVSKNSYHLKGMAVDISVPSIKTSSLRDIARSLAAGGVGYYPRSHFIHMDTGPVRHW